MAEYKVTIEASGEVVKGEGTQQQSGEVAKDQGVQQPQEKTE